MTWVHSLASGLVGVILGFALAYVIIDICAVMKSGDADDDE